MGKSRKDTKIVGEFLREVDSISERWYKTNVRNLAFDQKARLLQYIFRTIKTSVSQMARALGMERDEIRKLMNIK